MREDNFNLMLEKMNSHFNGWSKRALSLLGKVQIVKTFGISQYLYSLAVIDLLPDQWKTATKAVNKFIWNKNLNAARAPHRIKNEIMYRHKLHGGFGMIELAQIAKALKIRRYGALIENSNHPIAALQIKLGATEHLRQTPTYDIDDVTKVAMANIYDNNIVAYAEMAMPEFMADLLTHNKLLDTKISHLIMRVRINSIEHLRLRHAGLQSIRQLIEHPEMINTFLRICEPRLRNAIQMLWHIYVALDLPNPTNESKLHLYDSATHCWKFIAVTPSSQLRTILTKEITITNTKLMELELDDAKKLFMKIHKISSMQIRCRLLRLIHGDVYCGARTYRTGLTSTDRCVRCFQEETILHLLLQCPYTRQVWDMLGMHCDRPEDIIDPEIGLASLEIRADLVNELVFRKRQLPPEILIETTFNKFAKGLSKNNSITKFATEKLALYHFTGRWAN